MRERRFRALVVVSVLFGLGMVSGTAQVDLISVGSNWKYLDTGVDQGTGWRATAFPDGGWASGPAPLGYGEASGLGTTISYGGNDTNKHITYYFRQAFNVADAASITNLRARVRRDDGIVAYLNGTEVLRDNMPAGDVLYATLANGAASDDGASYLSFSMDAGLLDTGNNVMAVEIHQNAATSSDIVFDLGLTGNPLPTIAITSPTNGQVIANVNVLINGTATPGGPAINVVEVFAGGTKVGQSTDSSFSVVWPDVTPGAYSLTARITDSSGLRATSAPVAITVQAPPSGTLVSRGDIFRYMIGTQEPSSPSTLWRQAAFNDGAWSTGPTPVGYGDSGLGTTIRASSTSPTYTSVYLRRTFNVVDPASYSQLDLTVTVDDGAVAYINGVEAGRINAPAGELLYSDAALVAEEQRTLSVPIGNPGSVLVAGANVLALHVLNGNTTSSDLYVDADLRGVVDVTAPELVDWTPIRGAIVVSLTSISVIFSENVSGVDASDMTVNGQPVQSLTVVSPREYTFEFPEAEPGQVAVVLAAGGIRDLSPQQNAFLGASWSYTVDPNASLVPTLRITEVVARNSTLQDEDGSAEDWIEILNLGPLAANLEGYYLTDDPADLTQWRFPAVPMALGNYLIVWASGKDKTNYLGSFDGEQNITQSGLHTSFGLNAGGEYLALVDPSGTNIVSSITFPAFPDQVVSYGRDAADENQLGFYTTLTPGRPNPAGPGSGFAPDPVFSIPGGFYPGATVTVSLSAPSGTIYYTTNGSTPTQSSRVYTAPIVLGNSAMVKARVYQSPLFPSSVVAHSYDLAGTGLTSGFSSKLPIMIINTLGGGEPRTDNVRIPASITVIDTFRGAASIDWTPQFGGLCQIERRGQSSSGWPKGQYRFEINDPYGSDLEVPLLGLPEESDWIINGPYTDKSFLNNFLIFELHEEMGHYAVRRRFVELFLDTNGGDLTYPGDYRGIYVLLENIKRDNNRVDIAELTAVDASEPEVSGGYIFVYDPGKTSPTDYTIYDSSHTDDNGLKIREPDPDDFRANIPGRAAQRAWIANYLSRFEAAAYASDWLTRTGTNHYSHFIDLDTFVDNHWVVEFAKQIDGYRLSNYFSKDRGGKLKMAPIWDWNLSFGNADYLDGGNTNQWYFKLISDQQHIWLSRLIDGPGDPEFIQLVADRWGVLRTNIMYAPKVNQRVDEIYELLKEAAARDDAKWNRFNTYLWPNPGGPPTWDVDYIVPDYATIISEKKKWIAGRFAWLESLFVPQPSLNHPGGKIDAGLSLLIAAPVGTIYYTLDGTDPRVPGRGIVYTGPVVINENARVFARARSSSANNPNGEPWWSVWSPPTITTFVVEPPPLILTEIMYHPVPPPAGSPYRDEDFEYIELKNVGVSALSLAGYRFVNGLQFTFSGPSALTLDPGETALLVHNQAAFTSRYGAVANIAGTFTNNLANAGERITLLGPMQELIHDFTYSDDWHPLTDGFGFALVVADEDQDPEAWNLKSGWRTGSVLNGTPGQNEPPVPGIPAVLITEALTHTDPPQEDAIELYNPHATNVNVGGWFLSDDLATPKYRIPTGPGANIAAGGRLVIPASQYDDITLPLESRFDLRSTGDDVYLFSADLAGNLTGYVHGHSYGAALNGVSFGRYLTSTGAEHFVAQRANSLGSANAGPKVGPIVISEFMYRPPDVSTNNALWDNTENEYVELYNVSGAPVPLWDLEAPTNTWGLRDAVSFAFPSNTTIATGERVLVVSFSPTNAAAVAAFRAKFGLSPSIRLFGPYDGRLSNAEESLELVQPELVRFYDETLGTTNIVVGGVLVDQVEYSDAAPWPVAADGIGPALNRIVPAAYGNDPTNWVASAPTPGAGYVPGNPPVIVTQPADQTVVAFQDAAFSVLVSGAGPISYQWRFNSVIVPGATNATLHLSRVEAAQAGSYQVVVMNPANSVASGFAMLNVLIPASITEQPKPQAVRAGTNVTFNVVATSSTPISYQWRFNGVPIPGATGAAYTIAAVAREHDGIYDVVLTDAVGPVVSDPARLAVLIDPVIISFTTNYSVVQGDNLTMSIGVDGTLPMSYRWRRVSTAVKFETLNAYQSFFTLTNLQPNTIWSTNRYSVALTNAASWTPGVLSPFIYITVLTDSDGDGLPDDWESQYPAAGQPGDDTDGDGLTNKEEYDSGTDPTDPLSYLRINVLAYLDGANLEFVAVSNKTYTLQYKNAVDEPGWTRLSDVTAEKTTRTVVVNDPDGDDQRYYRLVTPRLP